MNLCTLGLTLPTKERCLASLDPPAPGQLVAECGGSLALPRLRWKYAWIEPLLGWSLATRAQYFLPDLKT
jgi:hypothetical protein